MASHKALTGTNIHVVAAYTYANATARGAATGFVSADLGKVAWQTDNNSLWLLTVTTPTWVQLGTALPFSGLTSTPTTLSGYGITDAQPLDTELTALAGLTSAANKGIQFTGSGTAATFDLTAAGKALLDDAAASNQRTTLGLGTIATQDASSVTITGGSVTGITDLALADGGTGASLADPNADRILFWDDSAGAMTWLTPGTGLTITTTTIDASGGGGSALTVEEVDGSPTDSAVTKIVFPNGTLGIASHVATYTPAGGGSTSLPTIIQSKATTGGTATSITLDAAPTSGNRLILFSNSTTGQITSVACTNVTWTQVTTGTSSGAFYAIWVGVVSGAGGTSITCSKPGTFNTMGVIEIADALTPTLGQSATSASLGATIAATTAGHLIVSCAGCDNTTVVSLGTMSVPFVGFTGTVASIILGYSQGNPIFATAFTTSAGLVLIAEIT